MLTSSKLAPEQIYGLLSIYNLQRYLFCRLYKIDMTCANVTSCNPLAAYPPEKQSITLHSDSQLINGSRISGVAAGSVSCWVRPN
jgi:hypothetical protein